MKQRGNQGVALIVTLILLAVITIVVVAFLAVSQRNRELVSTSSQLIDAKLMSEAALNRAQSEIAARMLGRTNLNAFEMLVSTNFTRTQGFVSGVSNPFNVSYSYDNVYNPTLGTPLSYQDLMLNLVNLYYDPRPPVFIPNDIANPFSRDFRFYLDLNRNGRFDATGYQTIIGSDGVRDTADRQGMISNYFIGDPEWIGVLEKPDQNHSSSNRFVGRYAYVVVPDGLTLDLNGMHNHAKPASLTGDGFLRNMGVGTWEMNLAGFLVGLNNNYWPGPNQFGNAAVDYTYNLGDLSSANSGFAFQDAYELLFYRYRSNPAVRSPAADFLNLRSYGELYGANAGDRFQTDRIDGYSDGPLLAGEVLPAIEDPRDPTVAVPWSGSPTPQEYFSQDDLFDPRKVGVDFLLRLDSATRAVGSYNSGTYYRLLSELGTQSGEEPASFVPGSGDDADPRSDVYLPQEKMNLNYDNRDLRSLGVPRRAASDVVQWEPLAFFTTAADRLLRSQGFVGSDGRTITLTNIMIWPTNNYDSAVHRCLQVAANLYDATTTHRPNVQLKGPEYPSVFRPMIRRLVTNGVSYVYITGYELQPGIVDSAAFIARNNYIDLHQPGAVDLVPLEPVTNQRLPLGVPLVIGVKKGYPNFNELLIRTVVNAQRNLIVQKPTANSPPNATNQIYILSVTNMLGLEAWNSYATAFPRDLQLAVEIDSSSTIQNRTNIVLWPRNGATLLNPEQTYATNYSIPASTWGAGAFQIPISTNTIMLTNSMWQASTFPFFRPTVGFPIEGGSNRPKVEGGFPIPDWQIYTTNRVRFVLTDGGRIVDFVNIADMTRHIDMAESLVNQDELSGDASTVGRMWMADRVGGSTDVNDVTTGIELQMLVSAGLIKVGRSLWNDYSPLVEDKDKSIDRFRVFLGLPPEKYPAGQLTAGGPVMQAPFTAVRKLYLDRRYQVNDPLVHFTYQDIYDWKKNPDKARPVTLVPKIPIPLVTVEALGVTNQLYSPWRGNDMKDAAGSLSTYNPLFIDPLINSSEDWSFPTNKFPSLGWMGRVHRGSAWQTIYLKSMTMPPVVGSGNTNNIVTVTPRIWASERGNPRTIPSSDWRFLDVFTTAPTPSATRGQLSVNQSGEAAWSAVLSGVVTLTNNTTLLPPDPYDWSLSSSVPVEIEPASAQFFRIVDGINRTRNNDNGGFFTSKGGILSVPEFSLASPYLSAVNWQDPGDRQNKAPNAGISDVAMERIPQQIMSLLRLGEPRVVIYAYGQSLAPAKNSLNLDPDFFQVVTNYQVTGEFVTRSVVRFEGDVNSTTSLFLNAVVVESKVLPPQ